MAPPGASGVHESAQYNAPMIGSILSIAAGASLGALLRWVLASRFNPATPSLPMGTLAANLIGGYLIGVAVAYFASRPDLPPEVRLFIITGFLGGLTTFSAFSGETVGLILRGHYAWTALMIVAHVVGSLVLTLAGVGLVRLALR